ncbi:MAG: TetR/AcrR family transcriptional regulator [Candidatus Merdivicinus sp.]|jgi:AcrR family transcriptional regulator
MKQEERTSLTRERIIKAAMREFGVKGYAGTTLNAICGEGGIAKGLFYHNFSGKDTLYLACVDQCFAGLRAYLGEQAETGGLQVCMKLRFRYFAEHPLCARIFFEAVLQPPPELAAEIRTCKREFDAFNKKIYQSALSGLTLRDGVTEADALDYYEMMQEMFNGYYSSPAYAGKDFQTIMADHEERLAKLVDFMLYGIAERRGQE